MSLCKKGTLNTAVDPISVISIQAKMSPRAEPPIIAWKMAPSVIPVKPLTFCGRSQLSSQRAGQ